MTDMSKDAPRHVPLIHSPWLYVILAGVGFLIGDLISTRYPKAAPDVLWTFAMICFWWAAIYSWWQWSNAKKWIALFRRWQPIVDNLRQALQSHDADKIIAACRVAEMDPSFMAEKMNAAHITEARELAALLKTTHAPPGRQVP